MIDAATGDSGPPHSNAHGFLHGRPQPYAYWYDWAAKDEVAFRSFFVLTFHWP